MDIMKPKLKILNMQIRPFNDKERHSDNIYLREKKAQERLLRDRYIEFNEKEFSIGIEESDCSVDYLDGYTHSVFMYLNRQGLQFRLTASKEKYVGQYYFEEEIDINRGKVIRIVD